MHQYAYKWGLIDANYILFRNKAILASKYDKEPIPRHELFSSVLQSFMKLKYEGDCMYPLYIWDKSPYHKLKTLQAYKADRWVGTDEEYDALEAEKATASPLRLIEIIEQQRKIRLDQANFETTSYVKNRFINDMGKYGFHSLIKQGYEADDLAFFSACQISELFKQDESNNAVLLTADKDWANFQLPGVDFLSTYNWSNYYNLTEEFEDVNSKINEASQKLYGRPCRLLRFQYGILEELMHKSHNNACVWSHRGIKRPEAIARFMNGDTSLIDYQLLHDAYYAMNMLEGTVPGSTETYKHDTEDLVKQAIDPTNFTYEPGQFTYYCFNNFLDTGFENYFSFVEGFKSI